MSNVHVISNIIMIMDLYNAKNAYKVVCIVLSQINVLNVNFLTHKDYKINVNVQ